MTRETKVGLLVGLCIILLIGILVSDHLAQVKNEHAPSMEQFAPQTHDRLTTPRLPGLDRPLPAPETAPPALTQVPPRSPLMPAEQPGPMIVPVPGSGQPEQAGADAVVEVALTEAPQAQGGLPGVWAVTGEDGRQLLERLRQVPPPSVRVTEPAGQRVRVQAGDTLFALAQRHLGNGELWPLIQQQNPDKVGPRGEIRLGTELIIPQPGPTGIPVAMTPAPGSAAVIPGTPTLGNPAPVTGNTPAASSQQRWVTVSQGQTLTELARIYLGGARRWPELLEANRDQLDRPEHLRAGMKLRLPAASAIPTGPTAATATAPTTPANPPVPAAPTAAGTYTVQPGDTLSSIAADRLGDRGQWERLFEANRRTLASADSLRPGQVLVIPR